MIREVVINQLTGIRGFVTELSSAFTPEQAEIIPASLVNNVRWQVGHVIYTCDALCVSKAGLNSLVPKGYADWFGNGTAPKNFCDETPDYPSLLTELPQSLEKVISLIPEQDVALPEPFVLGPIEIKTHWEIVSFSVNHECMHLGQLFMFKRLLLNP
jgi:DinB superfamily